MGYWKAGAGYTGSYAGGTHGGQGHDNTRACYGSVTQPTDLGSGAANWGTRGGGAVKLIVTGTLTVNGTIAADGQMGGGTGNYGGAGGSIWIDCATLAGTGPISADGGDAVGNWGGGGGRVAVHYDTKTLATTSITACGDGRGGKYGAAGTVYLNDRTAGTDELIVLNNLNSVEFVTQLTSGTHAYDTVRLEAQAQVSVESGTTLDLRGTTMAGDGTGCLYAKVGSTVNPPPGATWTISNFHFGPMGNTDYSQGPTFDPPLTNLVVAAGGGMRTPYGYRMYLVCSNLTVNDGASVSVYSRGFWQSGPGYYGSSYSGGTHGGQGNANPLACYGSIKQPTTFGSGTCNWGSWGGGAIKLAVADTVTVNGTITADGQTGGGSGSYGGAGGSAWIVCHTLAGTGRVSADGGDSAGNWGGGGGRMAIYYQARTMARSCITADGDGSGGKYGAAGTVYLKDETTGIEDLIIDNGGQNSGAYLTQLPADNFTGDPASLAFDSVIVTNQGKLWVPADKNLVVNRDFRNRGAFTASSGSAVVLASTNHAAVEGTTTFYYLTSTNPTKRVAFEAGKTFSVLGGVTMRGAAGGDWLELESSSPGESWKLNLASDAEQAMSYLGVEYSDASSGSTAGAADSTNRGNNVNWAFGGETIVWTGQSDTNWANIDNWDLARLPMYLDSEIIISNVANGAVLDGARALDAALTIQAGGRLTLNGHDLTLRSNVVVQGALIATDSETVTCQGDVDFTGGVYTQATTTVVLGGMRAQTVAFASNSFHRIEVTNTQGTVTFADAFGADFVECSAPGASLVFDAGAVYNFTNLVFAGEAGSDITLRSSGDGSPWYLTVPGWSQVRYVDVKDSDASRGNTIYAAGSTSQGGNDNWTFNVWLVWDGSDSSSFATAANWTPEISPTSTNMVMIDGNGANAPVISAPVMVRRLTVGGRQTSVLTLNKALTVTEDVVVVPGGKLTHTANDSAPTYALNLAVQGDLSIASGASIDTVARGYWKAGLGYTGSYAGGTHGGQGHDNTRACYGSVTQPTDLGSGAANWGTRGGGAVKLIVTGTLTVNGTIAADGQMGGGTGNYGGAGGSIWIDCATLAGTGPISADGGDAVGNWGGGGGRVAVHYDTKTLATTSITACGDGRGGKYGAAGTVYLNDRTAGTDELIVLNNLNSVEFVTQLTSGTHAYDTVRLEAQAQVSVESGTTLDLRGTTMAGDGTGCLYAKVGSTVNPPPGATWTISNFHFGPMGNTDYSQGPTFDPPLTNLVVAAGGGMRTPYGYRMYLVCSNLTVNDGASVSVYSRGFWQSGPGYYGSSYSGGTHGGQGNANPLACYGSIKQPTTFGSGTCNWGSWGGGAIKLAVADTVTVNGTITADGQTGGGSGSYGGAGGSAWIVCHTLAGTGRVSADGGDSAGNWGGGGGRMAIYYQARTMARSCITADGDGSGGKYGAAGTVYLKDETTGIEDLIIDNGGQNSGAYLTQLPADNFTGDPSSLAFDSVIVTNQGKLWMPTDKTLVVNGDFRNEGAFTASSGSTVTLASSMAATITGSTTFYNLTSEVTGKNITFEALETITVSGTLMLTGVRMFSSSPDTSWYLTVTGDHAVESVYVHDSNAENGNEITGYMSHSAAWNNVNWIFVGSPGTVFLIR